MSKTTIKELALSLSEKHDLSKADAERFVASIFEVINNGLEDDKLVKVKGLGAFKIIGVAARKSVDVNTGEPIVIEGRNKISFTPDASMRDDVNKPFSQFETVIINDGVDFSSIDKEYDNETENASEKENYVKSENFVDNAYTIEEETIKEKAVKADTESSSTKPIEENNEERKEETENGTKKDDSKKDDSKKEITKEEVAKKEEEGAKEEEANITNEDTVGKENIEQKETVVDETFKEEDKVGKENSKNEISIQECTEKRDMMDREPTDDEDGHQNHALKALIITAIVIVLGCMCGGYYLFTQIQSRDSHIEMLEKQMKLVTQHQKKTTSISNTYKQAKKAYQEQDSVPSKTDIKDATKQTSRADGKAELQDKQITSQEKTASQDKQGASQNVDKQAALQEQYNKDVRIRTGAYTIVGIKKTVTVRPGQTMDGISRSNLGPGMECYLEAVNGGKRELKAGENINIPELKLKKRQH